MILLRQKLKSCTIDDSVTRLEISKLPTCLLSSINRLVSVWWLESCEYAKRCVKMF